MKVTMEEQKLYDDFTVSVFQRGYEKGKEDATISYQNAYNEGHVDGYAKGLNDRKKEIEKAKREGYDEGVTDTIFNTDTYTQGLNDAWECARKLIIVESEGGLPIEKQLEIFDNTFPAEALKKYTASEAIAKIKEYEDKHTDDEIKLWDEVIIKRSSLGFEGMKGIVINTNSSEFNTEL
jgi:hypothetical protein